MTWEELLELMGTDEYKMYGWMVLGCIVLWKEK